MTPLHQQNCQPYSNVPPLDVNSAQEQLKHLRGWQANTEHTQISQRFAFKNYYQTIAFVNAVAYIVHQQDHHPDINFGYNQCHISFSTHSIDGLSMNDFICAARIDLLDI